MNRTGFKTKMHGAGRLHRLRDILQFVATSFIGDRQDLVPVSREPVRFYSPDVERVIRQECEFTPRDGARLSYSVYKPREHPRDEAVVYLHGIESHVAWFEGPASLLARRGITVYCLDRRGSGRNRENRGHASGHILSYEQFLADIHDFLKTIEGRHARLMLAGSSWGGKLALAYTLTYPQGPRVDALILITPGLRALVDLSLVKKLGVLASLAIRPHTLFKIPIQTEHFTTNRRHQDLIRRDPLRLHKVSARFFFESLRLDGFIDSEIHKNHLPILLVLAGRDQVIDNAGVLSVLSGGRQNLMEIRRYEEETHALQLDTPERLAQDIDQWIIRLAEGGEHRPEHWETA